MIPVDKPIAAVTVLFNPDADSLDTIRTYASQVDKCFLIDNSPISMPDVEQARFRDSRFEYRHMGWNRGPAAALNFGVRLAAQQGYRYVLTMDQDSRCSEGMVDLLHQTFSGMGPQSNVAVACPTCSEETAPAGREKSVSEVGFCMTSGNLMDVLVWERLGGFDEDLFIDYVDHDYCLRARAAGYRILRRNDAILYHHTGTLRQLRFLGFQRTISVHSPDRLLYMTRNGFLLKSRYGSRFPEVRTLVRKRTFAQAAKSLLFGPERWRRLTFMIRGYAAYKACVAGRSAL